MAEIERIPARDLITAQTMMVQYFGDQRPEVLAHTAAEWLAFAGKRAYCTWPRFSIPDTGTSGRPAIPLFRSGMIL